MRQQRTVLVTGGSRGIGAAVVRKMSALGDYVVFVYRSDHDAATRLAAELDATGAHVRAYRADLCDESERDALLREVEQVRPPLRGLVNCAGRLAGGPLTETSIESLRQLLEVNLVAPFVLMAGTVGTIRAAGGGAIVNVASVHAVSGSNERAAYAASKAALVGATKSLATELAPLIRVNAVMPGVFETDMTAGLQANPAALASVESRLPLGRLGRPADAADLITYLMSSEASYITGVCWEVDGGLTARTALAAGDPQRRLDE
jgi:3-oxoacyl-[acyl-carrier protein] reductase